MKGTDVTIEAPDQFASACQWADSYRALGLAVIPAAGREKIPLGRWREFQSGIPQTVHDRWYGADGEHRANYRMGFLTGAASLGDGWKLLVIDLDEKGSVSGSATWDHWIADHELGCDPDTWRARTGGGGQHIYFRYPAHLTIRNTQETFCGIDVRAEGGFVIAPPSMHQNGKSYSWLFSPFETELAEAPQWLLDKVGAVEALPLAATPAPSSSSAPSSPSLSTRTQTASAERPSTPALATDAWGHIVDGRDAYMRDMIWAAIVDWYRECPIPPSDRESEEKLLEVFAIYERKVRPQAAGSTLDDEGRGLSAFRDKWAYAMRQWNSKVAAAAKEEPAGSHGATVSFAPPPVDPSAELEWFDDIEPVISAPYIVKNVLDLGAMSVVYGPSNSGKTFFALDIAYHVAIDHRWRTQRVAGGGVLYLAAEGGNGIANRIVGLRKTSGVVDVPFALRRAGLDLLHPDADTERVITLARDVSERAPLKLIVIDTLSRVMAGGDENGPVDMTAFIKNVDRIRHATGAHIMIVHHTGKDVAKGARGHSSLRAATDTEIEVITDETEMRLAKVTKQRDLQGGEEFAFKLDAVALGVDQDGDAVTTCIVVPVEERTQDTLKLPPRAVCKAILKAVDDAWKAKNPFSMAPQSQKSGRYAPRALGQQFNLEGQVIENLLTGWIDNAIVTVEETDSHTKKRGLKVLEWLD